MSESIPYKGTSGNIPYKKGTRENTAHNKDILDNIPDKDTRKNIPSVTVDTHSRGAEQATKVASMYAHVPHNSVYSNNSRLMFTYGAQTTSSPAHHLVKVKTFNDDMLFWLLFQFCAFFFFLYIYIFLQALETLMKTEDHHFTVRSFLNIHS